MAYYSLHGNLTTGVLRSGRPLHVRSLEARQGNLPTPGMVFVPTSATFGSDSSWYIALVNAVNGCGSAVLTDHFQVNPETGAARMSAVANGKLAHGCASDLRILCNMYAESGIEALAAFAISVGVNQVLTVVAHTDEGGAMRDVLREGYFATPYGVVFTDGVDSYVNLPIPHYHSASGVQTWVDSVALRTAAVVSISDPLSYVNGRAYPTILRAVKDPVPATKGEDGHVPTIEVDVDQRRRLAAEIGPFSVRFADSLGINILGSSGGSEVVAAIVRRQALSLAVKPGYHRHFDHALLAPFHWVEPTSLFTEVENCPANNAGFGALCGTRTKVELLAWPDANILSDRGHRMYMQYSHRSARTVPALVHMTHHIDGGLAAVAPYQVEAKEIVLAGNGQGPVPNPAMPDGLEERWEDEQRVWSIDNYMWAHGASHIPSPAEFMVSSGDITVRIQKAEELDLDNLVEYRVVLPVDMSGTVTVTYSCSAPRFYGVIRGFAENMNLRRRGFAENMNLRRERNRGTYPHVSLEHPLIAC